MALLRAVIFTGIVLLVLIGAAVAFFAGAYIGYAPTHSTTTTIRPPLTPVDKTRGMLLGK